MSRLFGTDGVRGKVGEVLTPELAFRLGQAAGKVLSKEAAETHKKILIGRDSRLSGQMLEAALTAGLTSTGIDVVTCGLIPTPAVAWLVREKGAVAGVVISASHNPYWDNGIKFFNQDGLKLSDAVEDEIEALVKGEAPIGYAPVEALGTVTDDREAIHRYEAFLLDQASFEALPLKVVVDCANGSASPIADHLFTSLGLETTMIGHEPDGRNINHQCGSTHTEGLIAAVKSQGADIGLAFDGDADRFLAVTADGDLVDGDQLMSIYAHDFHQRGVLEPNLLVVTVMSNLGLKLAMQAAGIEVVETKVGDRYVNEALMAHDGVIGGEQSGHIIFRKINSTGDGLLSAIMLLNIMAREKKSLKDLAASMDRLPQTLINVQVQDKQGWETEASIQEAIRQAEASLGDEGRILVRASGTEPVLRVMVEGKDKATIDRLAQDIAQVIEKAIG